MKTEPRADGGGSATAPCEKCGTDISKTVKRCPECSYEPKNGTLSKIIFWLFSVWWVLAVVLLAIAAIVGPFTGSVTISESIGALVGAVIFGAIPFWHVTRYMKNKKKSATGHVE